MSSVSKISENRRKEGISISGQGMDRVVERKMPIGRKIGIGVLGLLALAFAWWLTDSLLGGRSLSVDSQQLQGSGGVLTPWTALGDQLVSRLSRADNGNFMSLNVRVVNR